jgi:hypothetical protein
MAPSLPSEDCPCWEHGCSCWACGRAVVLPPWVCAQTKSLLDTKANKASTQIALESKASKKKTLKLLAALEARWASSEATVTAVCRSSASEAHGTVAIATALAQMDAKISQCLRDQDGSCAT